MIFVQLFFCQVKNRISDEEKALSKVSTEEQREAVVSAANAAEEWLYEEGSIGNAANTKDTYKDKKKEIRKLAEAIFFRYSELTDRPAAVKKAQAALAEVVAKVAVWTADRVGFSYLTDKELNVWSIARRQFELLGWCLTRTGSHW